MSVKTIVCYNQMDFLISIILMRFATGIQADGVRQPMRLLGCITTLSDFTQLTISYL